jgi:hypothetical protein
MAQAGVGLMARLLPDLFRHFLRLICVEEIPPSQVRRQLNPIITGRIA